MTRRGTAVTVTFRLDRTSGAAVEGEQIAALPAGYRPTFPVGSGCLAYVAGWRAGGVIVTDTGVVSLYGAASATAALVAITYARA